MVDKQWFIPEWYLSPKYIEIPSIPAYWSNDPKLCQWGFFLLFLPASPRTDWREGTQPWQMHLVLYYVSWMSVYDITFGYRSLYLGVVDRLKSVVFLNVRLEILFFQNLRHLLPWWIICDYQASFFSHFCLSPNLWSFEFGVWDVS